VIVMNRDKLAEVGDEVVAVEGRQGMSGASTHMAGRRQPKKAAERGKKRKAVAIDVDGEVDEAKVMAEPVVGTLECAEKHWETRRARSEGRSASSSPAKPFERMKEMAEQEGEPTGTGDGVDEVRLHLLDMDSMTNTIPGGLGSHAQSLSYQSTCPLPIKACAHQDQLARAVPRVSGASKLGRYSLQARGDQMEDL
jgi:hypothetical protein